MISTPCPEGRLQAAALAAMNLRAVVGPHEVTYLAPLARKLAAVTHVVGPRFQPRNEHGRFARYAALSEAINLEYAWTAYEYDVEDEARREDEFKREGEIAGMDDADDDEEL